MLACCSGGGDSWKVWFGSALRQDEWEKEMKEQEEHVGAGSAGRRRMLPGGVK